MSLLELHLENVKSIVSGRAKLTPGVNFIYGPNGAGKSSILDALAFALYGTDWLKRVRLRLSDLVRVHSRTAIFRVKVRGVDGKIYIIQRAITPEKTIEGGTYVATEDGKRIATRDREVTQAVEKILGVPLSVFCELLYIRQGELRDILEASKRTEVKLDRVLKIETLDKLRNDYLREVKKQIEAHIRRIEGKLTYLNQELSKRKRELEELTKEKNNIETKLGKIIEELKNIELRKKEIENRIEEFKKIERKLREVEALLNVKLQEVTQINKKLEDIESVLRNKDALEKRLQELEKLETELEELRKKKEELINKKSKLESELDNIKNSQHMYEKIVKLRDSLAKELKKVEKELSSAKELENTLRELEERIKCIETKKEKLEKYKNKLSHYMALAERLEEELNLLSQAEGKCPLCLRELSKEEAEQLIKRKKKELDKILEKIEKLKKIIKKYENEVSAENSLKELYYSTKEKISRVKELEERKKEIVTRLQEIEEEIKKVENFVKSRDKIERELEEISEEIQDIDERIEKLCKEISEKDKIVQEIAKVRHAEIEKIELSKRLNEINTEISRLQEEYSRLSLEYSKLKEIEDEYLKITELEATLRDEYNQLSGRLKTIYEHIEKLKRDIDEKVKDKKLLEEEINKYANAYRFVSKLMDVVEKVKPVVRKIFIELLNQELNYMFLEVCHKSAFVGIRVTEDYEIYVKRKDGVELSVDALSVGEKNLVALLFRYALAKVVLGHIPFFILDEPTEHLDDEHRRRIAQWLKDISNDVDMIIITSHVDAFETVADNIIRVEFVNEKGESTFRNT